MREDVLQRVVEEPDDRFIAPRNWAIVAAASIP